MHNFISCKALVNASASPSVCGPLQTLPLITNGQLCVWYWCLSVRYALSLHNFVVGLVYLTEHKSKCDRFKPRTCLSCKNVIFNNKNKMFKITSILQLGRFELLYTVKPV